MAYASRNDHGVALITKVPRTRLVWSEGPLPSWPPTLCLQDLSIPLGYVVPPGPKAMSVGRQRKLEAEKKSVRKLTRNVPAAPEPAYDECRRPVEPERFTCSMRASQRSCSSSAGVCSPSVVVVAGGWAVSPVGGC